MIGTSSQEPRPANAGCRERLPCVFIGSSETRDPPPSTQMKSGRRACAILRLCQRAKPGIDRNTRAIKPARAYGR